MIRYTEPLAVFFLLILVVGIVRLRRSDRKSLILAGAVGLFLASWPPAAWLFSRPLEARYPIRPVRLSERPEAIVALGGAVSPPLYERPYPLPGQSTFENCEHAIWLFRRFGPAPVLVSGGGSAKHPPVSVTMREMLLRGGVPDHLIWTEDRSRSTHENAVYSAEILRRHGVRKIVLVVDAASMPRAAACFRKQGLEVLPAPSRFYQLDWTINDWIPGWAGLRQNEITLHETLGLLWYRLHGWVGGAPGLLVPATYLRDYPRGPIRSMMLLRP